MSDMNSLPVILQAQYNGKDIPVVMINGEPWWFAREVCQLLGYSRMRDALRMLRETQRGAHFVHTSGGRQRRGIISESGLYRLILRSNREESKPFQVWVEDVLLPQIRKTGMYLSREQRKHLRAFERPRQVNASKQVNAILGGQGGKNVVIWYNVDVSVTYSSDGKTPRELRELGEKLGLPARYRSSGAEVLRHIQPEAAAAMYAEKDLIAKGHDPEISRQFALEALPQFLALEQSLVRYGLGHARLFED